MKFAIYAFISSPSKSWKARFSAQLLLDVLGDFCTMLSKFTSPSPTPVVTRFSTVGSSSLSLSSPSASNGYMSNYMPKIFWPGGPSFCWLNCIYSCKIRAISGSCNNYLICSGFICFRKLLRSVWFGCWLMSAFYAFFGLKLLDLANFDFPISLVWSILASGVSSGLSKNIS